MKQVFYKNIRFFSLLLSFFGLISFSSFLNAQSSTLEYKIKAGYLYNFTKFIFWPENNLDTFNLCILGKDPFGSIIDPIEKRKVKNKPIKLFRLQSITEIEHCQIVYFNDPDLGHDSGVVLAGVLTISSLQETLTVGESKRFSSLGGMISFFFKDGKIKLHVNLKQLRGSHLNVSAKLLEIAEIDEGGADE